MARRIARKLDQGAVVWIMGCQAGRNRADMQRMANILQAKVKANTGLLGPGDLTGTGDWITISPNSENMETLRARLGEKAAAKKMNK